MSVFWGGLPELEPDLKQRLEAVYGGSESAASVFATAVGAFGAFVEANVRPEISDVEFAKFQSAVKFFGSGIVAPLLEIQEVKDAWIAEGGSGASREIIGGIVGTAAGTIATRVVIGAIVSGGPANRRRNCRFHNRKCN